MVICFQSHIFFSFCFQSLREYLDKNYKKLIRLYYICLVKGRDLKWAVVNNCVIYFFSQGCVWYFSCHGAMLVPIDEKICFPFQFDSLHLFSVVTRIHFDLSHHQSSELGDQLITLKTKSSFVKSSFYFFWRHCTSSVRGSKDFEIWQHYCLLLMPPKQALLSCQGALSSALHI